MKGTEQGIFRVLAKYTSPPQVEWVNEPPQLPLELEQAIEVYWQTLPKIFLFNGRLVRLDEWTMNGTLQLMLRPTDYRTLLYSNRFTEEVRKRWGDRCLSRALGISAVLRSSDSRLLYIRRSFEVGEFPGAYDVFGGHIEVPCRDASQLFAAMHKELEEEAGLLPQEVDLSLLGLIESLPNRKPELVFAADCHLTAAQITRRCSHAADRQEYSGIFSTLDEPAALSALLHDAAVWSPSAYGSLRLYLENRLRTGVAFES